MQLIFPGSYWRAVPYPHAQAPDIDMSALNIAQTSQYMSELNQYRNIGHGVSARIWAELLDVNPPNPFTDRDVADIVAICIFRNIVPPLTDPNILYFVIMPPGINYTDNNFIGVHTYCTIPPFLWNRVHYAWVTNDNTLEDITRIFSHELVEAVTDPEGNDIVGTAGTCSQVGCVKLLMCVKVNMVTLGGSNRESVQAYWSQNAQACVIPGRL